MGGIGSGSKKQINIDMELLKELYLVEKLPTLSIAKKLGVSQWTIENRLHNLGIMRSISNAGILSKDKNITKEDITKYNGILTIPEIAKKLGVSIWTVRHRLGKFDIKNIRPPASVITRKLISASHIGTHPLTETIEKHKMSMRKFYDDDKYIEKLSKSQKEAWKNGNHDSDKHNFKKNKCEIALENMIKLVSSNFVYYGDHKHGNMCGGIPDFIDLQNKKIIQHNGCFYHYCIIHQSRANLKEYGYLKSNEEIVIDENKRYTDNGYSVLTIWEHELYNTPEIVIKKLKEFTRQ